MRKINIVKDGKTKKVLLKKIYLWMKLEICLCEPRMLIRKDDDVYFTELPINYHGTKMRWSIFYLYDELNDLEKERFASRTITIPVTVDSVIKYIANSKLEKEKNKFFFLFLFIYFSGDIYEWNR